MLAHKARGMPARNLASKRPLWVGALRGKGSVLEKVAHGDRSNS